AARITEKRDDYNSFAPGASSAAAYATQGNRSIYSLRTFEAFPNDPLDSLLNAFSKLDRAGEGAAVQFVISPNDQGLLPRYRRALQQIHSGISLSDATHVPMGTARFFHEIGEALTTPKKLSEEERLKPDDPRIKNIEHKIESPLLFANLRLIASSTVPGRAKSILQDIEAPFQQFA